jgi:hypothetical protein
VDVTEEFFLLQVKNIIVNQKADGNKR